MTSAVGVQARTEIKKIREPKVWSLGAVVALLEQPINDLLFKAHSVHRLKFNPNEVQLSTLLNIKTGGCPEDCAYCPQSARYDTGVETETLLDAETVLQAAKKAKASGATRFCMGAAWRSPKERDLNKVIPLIKAIKGLGMESCVTLGMLSPTQAERLKRAGLDYYNHNLDTSPDYYGEVITTRTYQDRLDTLGHVRDVGINVCCGGIIGMGETNVDRAELLLSLVNLPEPPESVPINALVKVQGTPLDNVADIDPLDIVRMVATARIMMPNSYVRLSAGREEMTEEAQALCFFAGANSIFYGEQLLTTPNPLADRDRALFAKLGLKASAS
ncbi:MAG TPA: biotin synthase BioB [Gammaproteobacteria bacterium]|nr:biotin synthase BioB [Gammaproteobacteria bacterium]|tara:strand:+ start:458 stop:1450 length:993 start_codon:yes stop_codon:yes gene_type:complete